MQNNCSNDNNYTMYFLPLLIVKAPKTTPAGPNIIGSIISDNPEKTHPRIIKLTHCYLFVVQTYNTFLFFI